MSIPIGPIQLSNPFLLAPLAGITDSPFRQLCKEQGASLVYTEMISAKGLYYNDKATERLLGHQPMERPIAIQLFGSEPDIMAGAVKTLANRPNRFIDINMGCPVPKVVKNGEGSGLMKDPERAASLVRSMVKAEQEISSELGRAPKPITVKCRIGWDNEHKNILDFAERMEEAGAAAIAVHGRTREQYYSGKADWEAIAAVKERVCIPVIGSGDVFSGEDGNRMLRETGCDYVMFARGALGNPWIFRDALALYEGRPLPPPPSLEDKILTMGRQLSLLAAEKGEAPAVREMRKHVGWYLKGVSHAAEVRRQVNQITTAEDLKLAIETLL